MVIEMKRRDYGHRNELWRLDLREKAVLIGPDGRAVVEFEPAEAVSCFRLPCFGGDTHDFQIQMGDDSLAFAVAKRDLRQIVRFLNLTLVAGGPEVIDTVRRAAIRKIAIGIVCTIAGFGMTFLSYLQAASKPQGGEYTIFYGLAIFGVFVLGRGIIVLRRYEDLQRLSREVPVPRKALPQLSSPSAVVSLGPLWGEGSGSQVRQRLRQELGQIRHPLLKGVLAVLLVAGVVAFVHWRSSGFGASAARAIPRGELPPCYEGAQDLMAPTPEMIAAQLQREEQDAVEGLRECASFTGRYPESLGPELQETVRQIRAGVPSKAQSAGSDVGSAGTREARAVRVISLMSFYTVLRRDWKEPVYYGDTVKPGEAERVLLRWQPARNEYRVVYGDLRAETVTAERLAQLEAGQTPAPCSQVRQPQGQLPRARSMPVAMLLHQEVAALEGLRECGSFMGRYPESVGLPFDEMIRQIREGRTSPAQGAGGSADSVTARERRIERINRFLSFFATLRSDQREPVYHGDVVKPGAADRLLLRWQVEPNAYRVVYGDLRAEIVGAERLAQLEATLPK